MRFIKLYTLSLLIGAAPLRAQDSASHPDLNLFPRDVGSQARVLLATIENAGGQPNTNLALTAATSGIDNESLKKREQEEKEAQERQRQLKAAALRAVSDVHTQAKYRTAEAAVAAVGVTATSALPWAFVALNASSPPLFRKPFTWQFSSLDLFNIAWISQAVIVFLTTLIAIFGSISSGNFWDSKWILALTILPLIAFAIVVSLFEVLNPFFVVLATILSVDAGYFMYRVYQEQVERAIEKTQIAKNFDLKIQEANKQ